MLDLGLQSDCGLAHRFNFCENIRQMLFQHLATILHRRVPSAAQLCKRLHLADRHMRRSQTQQKFDPSHIRCRIAPLASSRTTDRGDQPDALVIAQGVGRQARALGDFINAQMRFHGVILEVRVHSKSTTLCQAIGCWSSIGIRFLCVSRSFGHPYQTEECPKGQRHHCQSHRCVHASHERLCRGIPNQIAEHGHAQHA